MTIEPRILHMARCYPSEAAHTPADERLRYFTPDQHLAWALRFAPHLADPDRIAALRNEQRP